MGEVMPPMLEASAMPMIRAFPNEQPVSRVLRVKSVWEMSVRRGSTPNELVLHADKR